MEFQRGLNVFSGENAFGKSTAITAIPWCLGLEPMFGLQNNDRSRFPGAVRDAITLGGVENIPVLTSVAALTLERDDGSRIALRRVIAGGDCERVEVTELSPDKGQRVSVLQARRETMSDETAGLQRFLFQWMRLSRTPVMTSAGRRSELYLENLAPLFFLDQNEGWTDLFALQVHRYQLQDVNEAAVEFLLGATASLAARLRRQERASREARLKEDAEAISTRVEEFFKERGWTISWSARGSTGDVANRWSSGTLSEIARRDFNMDVGSERQRLNQRLKALRDTLTNVPRDAAHRAPASQASQDVIELKTRRHETRGQLRDARLQLEEQQSLLETIEHRTASSKDILKLKLKGIGRLEHVECPTCHRNLDPSAFQLTQQSTESVSAHVDALERQRSLVRDNIDSLRSEVTRLGHELTMTESKLEAAERALSTVNMAVGTTREGLAKTAADIASTERELDSVNAFAKGVAALEAEVQKWIAEVKVVAEEPSDGSDLGARLKMFETLLGEQLLALGHSAVSAGNVASVHLDDRYIPYLGERRLRSLGSASDHPRLVAAYVLALAKASRVLSGQHPGFVVLDEPQQQNPDERHVELFLQFLATAAKDKDTQVIVTTHVKKGEVGRLRDAGVHVVELPPGNFLTEARMASPS